jgi:hypothetical protein
VTGRFDGGTISSDGGAVLLRETDRRLGLLERFSKCFLDGRAPERVRHGVRQMLAQRVYGLALGYEDLNDHEELRHDPLLGFLAGRSEPGQQPLAGKSTLSRLELGTGSPDRYKKITFWRDGIDDLLVDVFLEAHASPPAEIILDIDATDLPLHGRQEGYFYHGFYGHHCYLPLYVFSGEHVLCARLRRSNIDASAGSLSEIKRIVARIRVAWPEVRIILRGDSGFCRNDLMDWCEKHAIDFVFGLARNSRLEAVTADALATAQGQFEDSGKPERVFIQFEHETLSGSWSRKRRVVAKAEHIDGKSNPRFVVTSLAAEPWPGQQLYEELYCARGDMENRIKEQFVLFADRVSAATMRANQLRLYLSLMAYILVAGLRRLGLKNTALASAQAGTIRLRLLKIGAQIRITARRIWIHMPSSYPSQSLFTDVVAQLRC